MNREVITNLKPIGSKYGKNRKPKAKSKVELDVLKSLFALLKPTHVKDEDGKT